ncbi:MAG: DegT/DnrJ/EryC1/StrS family aminotransferase, partial [Burkholderiales bacterium]
ERFDWEVARRQDVARRYDDLLAASGAAVTPVSVRPDRNSVYAQYTVLARDRARLEAGLHAEGVPTAVHYPAPLHRQPAYARYGLTADLPVSEKIAGEVISLPMYPDMPADIQERIARAVQNAC